jgi:hypothetical protein
MKKWLTACFHMLLCGEKQGDAAMNPYVTLQEFERDGFQVVVETCAEDAHPSDFFDDTCHDLQDMVRKIDYGVWDWFQVRVRVQAAGVELGRAHLGGCLYGDRSDVLTDGVVEDLIQESLDQARDTVTKLRDQLPLAA